jgi:hypothetical protein
VTEVYPRCLKSPTFALVGYEEAQVCPRRLRYEQGCLDVPYVVTRCAKVCSRWQRCALGGYEMTKICQIVGPR